MTISWILFGIFAVWLCVISVIIFKIWAFFKTLSKDIKVENLTKLLGTLAQKEDEHSNQILQFEERIKGFEKNNITHMQKYGFVRFNPFNDMGGDHSFSLALLNGLETGFILTGLHTRDRTRVYVKYIKRGKSEYDLSKEELKALTHALQN